MESAERPLTPKERYDLEMQRVRDNNLKAKGKHPDEEKELDELTDAVEERMEAEEKAIDKNMGETKVPNKVAMTKEEWETRKAQSDAQAAMAHLRQHNRKHLTPTQEKKLKDLEEKFQNGEVTDPVLMHLLKKRRKGMEKKKALADRGRELNVKLLNELTQVTTEAMENAGMLKEVDKDLLEHIEQD